jgi:hypothetical protein
MKFVFLHLLCPCENLLLAPFLLECLLFLSEHDDDFTVKTLLALGPSLSMPVGNG